MTDTKHCTSSHINPHDTNDVDDTIASLKYNDIVTTHGLVSVIGLSNESVKGGNGNRSESKISNVICEVLRRVEYEGIYKANGVNGYYLTPDQSMTATGVTCCRIIFHNIIIKAIYIKLEDSKGDKVAYNVEWCDNHGRYKTEAKTIGKTIVMFVNGLHSFQISCPLETKITHIEYAYAKA